MQIVGIQRNVTFKFDGNVFTGINLYCALERDGVEGHVTEKHFVNSSKECFGLANSLKVGDQVNIYYNRYGKIDAIVPIKKP